MPIMKHYLSITEDDLQGLVKANESEIAVQDFKRDLPLLAIDNDKREFLADVTSFANTAGGHIYYGIDEDKGQAVGVPGVQPPDVDALKLQMESIIRTGTEPPTRVNIAVVPLANKNVVFAIHVPKSLFGLHRIVQSNRIYGRNSAGKFMMTMLQIKEHLVSADALAARVQSFAQERIMRVLTDETPVPLSPGMKLVIHVIPHDAFSPEPSMDFLWFRTEAHVMDNDAGQLLTNWSARDWLYNLHGFLYHVPRTAYKQFFRNGIVEAVDAPRWSKIHFAWERDVVTFLKSWMNLAPKLKVIPPFTIILSMVNVKAFVMHRPEDTHWIDDEDLGHISENTIVTPDILVHDFEADPWTYMKPAFDVVWNACGYPESLSEQWGVKQTQ